MDDWDSSDVYKVTGTGDNPHFFHPKTTIDHTIEYEKFGLEDEFPFAGECVGC